MRPTIKSWLLPTGAIALGSRPLVMGIVNVTPDSFSDGGSHSTPLAAARHGLDLVEQGAEILDVGGESTRPGAAPVPLKEELRRVVRTVELIKKKTSVLVSIDTCKAEVARQCLLSGASIINDVTACRGDPDMVEVARAHRAGVILMHMQGTPQTMQLAPAYRDVVKEVRGYLKLRLQALVKAGIAEEALAVDPGIGFGKSTEHNLKLLSGLACFQKLGRPVCLGVSRKGFLGRLLKRDVGDRLPSSLAAICFAQSHGAAQIVRVHDVAATRDAVIVIDCIREGLGLGKTDRTAL